MMFHGKFTQLGYQHKSQSQAGRAFGNRLLSVFRFKIKASTAVKGRTEAISRVESVRTFKIDCMLEPLISLRIAPTQSKNGALRPNVVAQSLNIELTITIPKSPNPPAS